MHSSTVLITDKNEYVSLLAVSPKDVRKLLCQGIARWQGERIIQKFEHQFDQPQLWMRALRACVGGRN
eukprot:3152620-Pyramimonas_sp.AAC.1